MEISGQITWVSPRQDGVSKTSGKSFAKQEYVIYRVDRFGNEESLAFTVFGESRLAAMELKAGDTGTLTFYTRAREWNGRYFNDVVGTKFARTQPAAGIAGIPETAPQAGQKNDLPF